MIVENNIVLIVTNEDIENGTCIIPDYITAIGDFAFECCENLQYINIPNGVIEIGDYAFISCINLTSIYIPNSVTYIGWKAFENCANLESINIPNSIKRIGDGAFIHCKNLIKKGKYKACKVICDENKTTYSCRGTEYKIGKQMPVIDKISCCERGYHYVENLYDIFNYYYGDLNEIALFEVEPGNVIEKDKNNSKCVTNTIKLVRQIPWSEVFEENK